MQKSHHACVQGCSGRLHVLMKIYLILQPYSYRVQPASKLCAMQQGQRRGIRLSQREVSLLLAVGLPALVTFGCAILCGTKTILVASTCPMHASGSTYAILWPRHVSSMRARLGIVKWLHSTVVIPWCL